MGEKKKWRRVYWTSGHTERGVLGLVGDQEGQEGMGFLWIWVGGGIEREKKTWVGEEKKRETKPWMKRGIESVQRMVWREKP